MFFNPVCDPQGEDRLYLNLGQTREFNDKPPSDEPDIVNTSLNQSKGNISLSMMSSGSKLWTTISIPHTYMGSSWPIRVRFDACKQEDNYNDNKIWYFAVHFLGL